MRTRLRTLARITAPALVLAVLSAAVAGNASLTAPAAAEPALRRWTFEQCAFGGPTRSISDHYFLHHEGLWHLFYTHLATGVEPQVFIGHAVSADRRDWSERAPVVTADAEAPAWRRLAVWAPMLAEGPDGGWVMAITGVDEKQAQRIGLLHSDDLESWAPLAGATPFSPDTAIYAWTDTAYSTCRDPHLFFEDGVWHLLFTARTAAGLAAIGHATSPDLLGWTQHDPLLAGWAPWAYPDAESPGLMRFGGEYVLWYTFSGVRMLRADSLAGPWPADSYFLLDIEASGAELVPSGDGLFLSRRRTDRCHPGQTLIWTDSLDTAGGSFRIVPWEQLPWFSADGGLAFLDQPSFGDGQEARGEPPAGPSGLFWLSSREYHPLPSYLNWCGREAGAAPVGRLRSEPFVLAGDSVAVRINGADSPDSAYVLLRDACTGEEIVRFTGGGAEVLTPQSASVGARRGRPMEWRIADLLERPGGWIGVDDLEERASPGLGPLPKAPEVTWLAPAGGENFLSGEPVALAWQTSAGVPDSLVLYLTYDRGETLLRQAVIAGDSTTFTWTVPDSLHFDTRLRLVAYAGMGAASCATSQPFRMNAAVGVPPELPAGGALRAVYGAAGVWLEGEAGGPAGQPATLTLFDLRGRKVGTLWQGRAGEAFRVRVGQGGGETLAPGVYFARLRAGPSVWRASLVLTPAGGR